MHRALTPFSGRIAALAGKTLHAATAAQAREYVDSVTAGKTVVASNAPYLRECGIASGAPLTDQERLRELCATADFGITSADYALADTGTLVMLSSAQEARMVSLLPPAHIAVVPADRILTGLDELLTILPYPPSEPAPWFSSPGPAARAISNRFSYVRRTRTR